MEEFARGLEGVVEVLLREVGKEELILVGHSMSGVSVGIILGLGEKANPGCWGSLLLAS